MQQGHHDIVDRFSLRAKSLHTLRLANVTTLAAAVKPYAQSLLSGPKNLPICHPHPASFQSAPVYVSVAAPQM